MSALWVALGAAIGAPLRFALGTWLDDRLPYGTLTANTAASAVVGLATGWALTGAAATLLVVGFCGGLSTYSSLAVQAHDLPRHQGLGYALATIVLGLAACTLGYVVAQA